MPFVATCPSCSAELRLPDRLAGHRFRCPHCGGWAAQKLKIIWREWDHEPDDNFGHGVGFFDVGTEHEELRLVGFVHGFPWRSGISDEVVIYCIKPDARTSQDILATMQKRIEEMLARGELPTGQITPRIRALANA